MTSRNITFSDRLLGEAHHALRAIAGGANATTRISPAREVPPGEALHAREADQSARLMRVNHAGEVSAQALYQGQAMTARLENVRDAMRQAAQEEVDHLAWCEERLQELGSGPSLLGPVWYAGSFAIGAVAGLAGDRWSLGFVAETEAQVVRHIDRHLQRLPAADKASRAILQRMREDEARHGSVAQEAGGAPLPAPVQRLMERVSKVMTRAAYWI